MKCENSDNELMNEATNYSSIIDWGKIIIKNGHIICFFPKFMQSYP